MQHVKDIIESLVEDVRVKLGTSTPYFFHGTPKQIASHLDSILDSVEKYPLIYLFETNKTEGDLTANNNVEREITVRLFFGTDANPDDWEVEDFYNEVLDDIRIIVDTFYACVRKSKKVIQTQRIRFSEETHTNWGLYVKNQGHSKNIFNDQLSGIDVQLTFSARKDQRLCVS